MTASGAISGLAAGVTCGASVVASVAVIGATSFAGNVVGQGISKGFNKIDYKEALISTATDVVSFGMARKFGPAVKAFGSKVVSKVKSTASNVWNKIDDKVSGIIGNMKGGSLSKPNQVHHFLTNKSKTYTKQFENITKKYGLDLDGDWNKKLMSHQGRHPNAYHKSMLKSVKGIDDMAKGSQKVFLKEFNKVKNNVIRNPKMLTKQYWKGM